MYWLNDYDIWEVEGYGKYPVLGCPDKFVYFEYDKNEAETIEDLVLKHRPDDWGAPEAYLVNYNEPLDEDGFNTYSFWECKCAVSKQKFFLVCNSRKYSFIDEGEFIFIPGHTYNIKLFRNYLLTDEWVLE